MLSHLYIKDFTIINALSLNLKNGFTVLTGETGAGKSIIVDAVNLALGGRADKRVVRQGCERSEVVLSFDIDQLCDAKKWLIDHDLNEDECLLRRIITKEGRSQSTINGVPFPQQLVRELGELLLTIYGQHEHLSLKRTDVQRERLDLFASTQTLLNSVATCYQRYREIDKKIERLNAQAGNKDHLLELLNHELAEIKSLNLQVGEWAVLSDKHKQLHQQEDTVGALQASLNALSDQTPSAQSLLESGLHSLAGITDERLTNAMALLKTAQIHLDEAVGELYHYQDARDVSYEQLAEIEERVGAIHQLSRKHHVEPDALLIVQENIETKIDELNDISKTIEHYEQEQAKLLDQYQTLSKKITHKRKLAAQTLSKKITEQIKHLGIEGGAFRIKLEPTQTVISKTGSESVRFFVMTNPNQPFQPIENVASGGELSRIGLSLQVMLAQKEIMPTLIFDEVDVGIGGKTAEKVGQLLRTLGDQTQILSITHLLQVAVNAHHHLVVDKQIIQKNMKTSITLLDEASRLQELARMSTGAKITEETLKHVKVMRANSFISHQETK